MLEPLLSREPTRATPPQESNLGRDGPTETPAVDSGTTLDLAVLELAQGLEHRQAIHVGRGLSKLIHIYASPLLRDLTAFVLVISAVAVFNMFGILELAFACESITWDALRLFSKSLAVLMQVF